MSAHKFPCGLSKQGRAIVAQNMLWSPRSTSTSLAMAPDRKQRLGCEGPQLLRSSLEVRGCVGLRLLLSLHPLPLSLMHSAASAEKGLESAAVQKHPSRHEPSTGRLVARSDCGNRETRGPRVAMGFLGGNDLECEKPYRNHTIGRASRAPTRIAAAAQRGLRMAAQVTDQRLVGHHCQA